MKRKQAIYLKKKELGMMIVKKIKDLRKIMRAQIERL